MKKEVLSIFLIISLFISFNNGNVFANYKVIDVLEPGMTFTFTGSSMFNQSQGMVVIQTLHPNDQNPILLNYTAQIMAFNTTANTRVDVNVTEVLNNNKVNTTQTTTTDASIDTIGIFMQGLWNGAETVWNNNTASGHDQEQTTENDSVVVGYTIDYFPDYEDMLSDLKSMNEGMNDTDMPQPMADYFATYNPSMQMDSTLTSGTYHINNADYSLSLEKLSFTSLTNHTENGNFDLIGDNNTVIPNVPYDFYFYNSMELDLSYDTETGMLISYSLLLHMELNFIFMIYDSTNDVSVVAGYGTIMDQNINLQLTEHSLLYGNEPQPQTTSTEGTTNSTSPINPLPSLEFSLTILTLTSLAILPLLTRRHQKNT